jgi:hypothetical protein
MALLTYADTQGDSAQYPGSKIWQRMQTRIASIPSPMPPTWSAAGPLSAAEQSALSAWFAAGAPNGTCP